MNNCPHCGVSVQFVEAREEAYPPWAAFKFASTTRLGARMGASLPNHQNLFLEAARCPNCGNTVIAMLTTDSQRTRFVWPESVTRAPIPLSVPDHIAEDYREAVLVIPYSPKASAALSRRCLQHLLHEHGFQQKDLVAQIQAAIPTLPKFLAHEIDTVRVIGNMAAHPMKSTSSGAIIGVEDGEAEWNIEVLEMLFDHFYLRPDDVKARKAALNKKLSEAGKKPLP